MNPRCPKPAPLADAWLELPYAQDGSALGASLCRPAAQKLAPHAQQCSVLDASWSGSACMIAPSSLFLLIALLLQSIISNATRWDTFEHLLSEDKMPRSEQKFRERYKKSPSFLSIHMGVRADALPQVGSVAVPCCLAGSCTLAGLQIHGFGAVKCRSACLHNPPCRLCKQTRWSRGCATELPAQLCEPVHACA